MILQKDLEEIREAFLESARPLIFFDDDPDGMCSFLQFYHLNTEAKGIIYKVAGPIDKQFLKKIDENHPDRVFILDVPNVTQGFADKAGTVYWIDHHSPVKLAGVKYYNPMIKSKGKDNRPISYWSHLITRSSIWLAMVGCISDWFIPEDLREEFSEKYPDLLPAEVKKPEDALFSTQAGKLARILSFILKGTTKDAMTCVKIMTRIKDPYEILDQSTAQGKYIWKKYAKINRNYQEIKDSVMITEDPLVLFLYSEDKMSLTSDLSNEMLYENPDKFIIIGRKKGGEFKCSLRSGKHEVLNILNRTLKKVRGYGGGHLHACGANIKEEDFDRFIEMIRKEVS